MLLQAEVGASELRRMAGAEGEGWAADVRVGLYTILVSRVGQHQRHSALCLAAAVLELLQPQWLLGPMQPVTPWSSSISSPDRVSQWLLLVCIHAQRTCHIP